MSDGLVGASGDDDVEGLIARDEIGERGGAHLPYARSVAVIDKKWPPPQYVSAEK